MTAPVLVAVGLAGGAGAVGRVLLDRAAFSVSPSPSAGVSSRWRGFPLGTLVVNLSGAFVLGLLLGLGAGADVNRIVGTGMIGGFTTFSTWMYESHQSAGRRGRALAAVNLTGSLIAGLALAWAGRRVGIAL